MELLIVQFSAAKATNSLFNSHSLLSTAFGNARSLIVRDYIF
jgi:hypothetical protein